MSNPHVTTQQLNRLVELIDQIYSACKKESPIWYLRAEDWQEWRDDNVRWLHSVYKPSARPYAGRVIADIAYDVFKKATAMQRRASQAKHSEEMKELYWEQAQTLRRHLGELKKQADLAVDLQHENEALRQQVARLQAELARRPSSTTVTIPRQRITVQSEIQQTSLYLIGAEGLGRSWRIFDRIVENGAGTRNSVRNAIRRLRADRGLIDGYREHGRERTWRPTSRGAGRQLLVLTDLGREWYSAAYGRDPVESEIAMIARRHKSVTHGVGVLEAHDHLSAAGYDVDDDPEAMRDDDSDRWGVRAEPDLVVVMDGHRWPIEVQRETHDRLLHKWEKILGLVGRLALILFNEEKLNNQLEILNRAARAYDLPDGEIRLVSLEAMEAGDWTWRVVEGINSSTW